MQQPVGIPLLGPPYYHGHNNTGEILLCDIVYSDNALRRKELPRQRLILLISIVDKV